MSFNPIKINDQEFDDDPFYELYNCYKITFLESKLKKSVNTFIRVEFDNVSGENGNNSRRKDSD
jgi:hypothetical protein